MDPDLAKFWNAVDAIRERDPRYRPQAYGFVFNALWVALQAMPPERRADPVRRHLTCQELLDAVIALGRSEFGSLATTVFREWGVESSGDVGAIVFQLIDQEELTARPEDSPESFLSGPDLFTALGAP